MAKLPLGLRFSLGELLLLVLFAGLGLAAMRMGGTLASVAIFAALLLCVATAIVAVVGAGTSRAYAAGFSVAVLLYGVVVAYCGPNELNPGAGVLPTTDALAPVRRAMTTRTYTDLGTGRQLSEAEYQTLAKADMTSSGGGSFGGGGFFGTAAIVVSETPGVTTLMAVGHVLIALLLGYVGGKFGEAVYRRREPAANSAEGNRT